MAPRGTSAREAKVRSGDAEHRWCRPKRSALTVGRIVDRRAADDQRIGIDVGLQDIAGDAPHALSSFSMAGARRSRGDLLRVGRAEAEGDPALGGDLGRFDRRRAPAAAPPGRRRRRGAGRGWGGAAVPSARRADEGCGEDEMKRTGSSKHAPQCSVNRGGGSSPLGIRFVASVPCDVVRRALRSERPKQFPRSVATGGS